MKYIKYSSRQLEHHALGALEMYDKELLCKTKVLDVYDVIEKLLDVPYDWKYLTPDQSVLGATVINSGFVWVWPKPYYCEGMKPYKLPVEEGTILIDNTLIEEGNKGRENFTVMHEVFHLILHQDCFSDEPANYAHFSKNTERNSDGHKKLVTAIDYIEYQANYCAACFLMPHELLVKTYNNMFSLKKYKVSKGNYLKRLIREMAVEFNVSETAMKYRLENLKMLRKAEDGEYYEPVNSQ